MGLKNKIKRISDLKRYSIVWEWMEEHQSGEYVKYDEVVSLLNKESNRIKEFEEYIEGIGVKIKALNNYLEAERLLKYLPITVDKMETKIREFILELQQEIIALKKDKYCFKKIKKVEL